jgi:hypothetical protein
MQAARLEVRRTTIVMADLRPIRGLFLVQHAGRDLIAEEKES